MTSKAALKIIIDWLIGWLIDWLIELTAPYAPLEPK